MTGSADPVSVSADSPAPAAAGGRALRMAVVGMSTSSTCGVRDHARLLADALGEENVSCSVHWLYRSEPAIRATRAQIGSWAQGLAAELDRDRPEAVLLHYSVFSYSYRGLPLFVHPTLSALRRAGLHGAAWALSQRALLLEVMRASAAGVVTIDARAEWLASRAWLPRRPLAFAPVFSSLPAPTAGPRGDRHRPLIGLFGYSHEGAAVSLVLDALRLLEDRGRAVGLVLLGAPGRDSAVGEAWLAGARERDIGDALSFSGTLAAQ